MDYSDPDDEQDVADTEAERDFAPLAPTTAPAPVEAVDVDNLELPILGENASGWVPTVAQSRLLAEAQKPGYRRKNSVICEAAGVPAPTFRSWMQRDPQFRFAWENIWKGAISAHLPGVVAAMIERATEGDVQAAKFVAMIDGKITSKNESTVNVHTDAIPLALVVAKLQEADKQLQIGVLTTTVAVPALEASKDTDDAV